jgi:glycosyltransferase involved in cell wall biosynthesis
VTNGDPIITIGMPLYNNARTIRRALESLLAQTERRLRIVASDDGSNDETTDIVATYAESDPRIRLVRQARNLNYGNFRFVLNQADTPYFMFAAGDDWWEPDSAERCIALLEENQGAVAAIPKVLMHPEGRPAYPSIATSEIRGDVATRLATYLESPDDNSRLYGVYRTSIARRAFPRGDHHAFDWTFSAATLLHGEHLELPYVGMHREVTPNDRYIRYVRRDASGVFSRVFPLAPMTRSLVFEQRIPLNRRVLRALYYLNKNHHREYLRTYHPRALRVYHAIDWLGRRVRRRSRPVGDAQS